MKLATHSKHLFYKTFADYGVPKEWADVMFNYLAHGLPPGDFFTALLANDAMAALTRSHPANTIDVLKKLVTWISNMLPAEVTHGSYEIVNEWLGKTTSARRKILEAAGLVYSEEEEFIMGLEGKQTEDAYFW